jgi:hypothetical protein
VRTRQRTTSMSSQAGGGRKPTVAGLRRPPLNPAVKTTPLHRHSLISRQGTAGARVTPQPHQITTQGGLGDLGEALEATLAARPAAPHPHGDGSAGGGTPAPPGAADLAGPPDSMARSRGGGAGRGGSSPLAQKKQKQSSKAAASKRAREQGAGAEDRGGVAKRARSGQSGQAAGAQPGQGQEGGRRKGGIPPGGGVGDDVDGGDDIVRRNRQGAGGVGAAAPEAGPGGEGVGQPPAGARGGKRSRRDRIRDIVAAHPTASPNTLADHITDVLTPPNECRLQELRPEHQVHAGAFQILYYARHGLHAYAPRQPHEYA